MTLGEIIVSCHTSYDRQKPALKLTAFARTQLLVRPSSLLLCSGIAPALFLPTRGMTRNTRAKIKKIYIL